MKQLRRAAVAASVACVVFAHGNAGAAGFALYENSGKGLGNVFAGGSASAENASTVFFNPAGMTRLGEGSFAAAAHVIDVKTEFTDGGSALNPALTGGTVVPGTLTGGNDDGGKLAVVPNLYYTRQLTDRLFVGLGINTPFGLATEYNADWTGRYHAIESDLITFNINPALAFKATDQLSLAFGLNVQYADVLLSNALDLSTACLGVIGAVGCAGLPTPLITPGSRTTDGFQELTADDWSYGFNVGVLFELNEDTRFGAHYRSRVTHDLEGKVDFTGTDVLAGAFGTGALTDQKATAKLTLPETLSLSVFHRIDPKWAVMADATWTRWSHLDVVTANFAGGQSPLNLTLNWENTWRLAVGVNHYLNDRWTLRGGVAYDESPTPNFIDRSARVPDADRLWLGVGASYEYSDTLSVDVAYAYLVVGDVRIRQTDPSFGHRLIGSYDSGVEILSGQVNWRF